MTSDYVKTGKLQRKIDIYMRDHCGVLQYKCSTNWWRTCRDAAQNWANMHLNGNVKDSRGKRQVVAYFA